MRNPANRARPRLLIVDDEEFNLDLLEHAFAETRFEIIRASNANEALHRLEEIGTCSAILLDCQMPGIHGFDLLKILKADERYRNIPVVMQSADDTYRRESIKHEAHGYLVKPYSPESVLDAVQSALRSKSPA